MGKRAEKTFYFVKTKERLISLTRYAHVFGLNYMSIVVRIWRMDKEEREAMLVDNILYIPTGHPVLEKADKRRRE